MWWRDDFCNYDPDGEYGLQYLFGAMIKDARMHRFSDLAVLCSVFACFVLMCGAAALWP